MAETQVMAVTPLPHQAEPEDKLAHPLPCSLSPSAQPHPHPLISSPSQTKQPQNGSLRTSVSTNWARSIWPRAGSP